MLRAEVLRKRLNKLDEYLAILRSLQRYSFDEFASNPERYGSAERFLQLAIEALNDMGNHVIADLNLGPINAYSDIPLLLQAHGTIDAGQQAVWVRMIDLHNVLMYEYLDIDRTVVYEVLHNNLDDIAALQRAFALFL
jgi:uncharacterized protein YutE (UPF0331/DUF86 family)